MAVSRSNVDTSHSFQRQHLGRYELITLHVANAKLARAARAPCKDSAINRQCHRVVAATADLHHSRERRFERSRSQPSCGVALAKLATPIAATRQHLSRGGQEHGVLLATHNPDNRSPHERGNHSADASGAQEVATSKLATVPRSPAKELSLCGHSKSEISPACNLHRCQNDNEVGACPMVALANEEKNWVKLQASA